MLAFAYDLEQAMQVRRRPQFLHTVSDPPNAGICNSLLKKPHVFTGKAHLPHGRIFAILKANPAGHTVSAKELESTTYSWKEARDRC